MVILALDSTAQTASAAIMSDGKLKSLMTLNSGNTHSETLLPMIEEQLKLLKLTPKDIGLFAMSAGPGSFTGVRIGAATVKGLAFGTGKPCVGVSTLEALANNMTAVRGIICPVMNARRGQVYNAIFTSDGNEVKRITDDAAIPLSELEEMLSGYDGEIYFTGDGYDLAHDAIKLDRVRETPEMLRYQNALSVALCAEKKYLAAAEDERMKFTGAAVNPVYLRKPQAEREREERLKAAAEKH